MNQHGQSQLLRKLSRNCTRESVGDTMILWQIHDYPAYNNPIMRSPEITGAASANCRCLAWPSMRFPALKWLSNETPWVSPFKIEQSNCEIKKWRRAIANGRRLKPTGSGCVRYEIGSMNAIVVWVGGEKSATCSLSLCHREKFPEWAVATARYRGKGVHLRQTDKSVLQQFYRHVPFLPFYLTVYDVLCYKLFYKMIRRFATLA